MILNITVQYYIDFLSIANLSGFVAQPHLSQNRNYVKTAIFAKILTSLPSKWTSHSSFVPSISLGDFPVIFLKLR